MLCMSGDAALLAPRTGVESPPVAGFTSEGVVVGVPHGGRSSPQAAPQSPPASPVSYSITSTVVVSGDAIAGLEATALIRGLEQRVSHGMSHAGSRSSAESVSVRLVQTCEIVARLPAGTAPAQMRTALHAAICPADPECTVRLAGERLAGQQVVHQSNGLHHSGGGETAIQPAALDLGMTSTAPTAPRPTSHAVQGVARLQSSSAGEGMSFEVSRDASSTLAPPAVNASADQGQAHGW